MIVANVSRSVKPFAILFAPSMTRGVQNPRFGFGLSPAKRLPVGPSDADRAFAMGACPATAPTSAEVLDEFRVSTLSPSQHRDLMEDVAYCSADRDAILEARAREFEESCYWDGSRPVIEAPRVGRKRHVRVDAAKARRMAAAGR